MSINHVSLLGLGAEGAVAYYALRQAMRSEQIAVLASGSRAERLKENGIIINDTPYSLSVRPAGDTSTPPDLLIIAVKSYQLESVFPDIAKELGPNTTIMSMINGLSSENQLAEQFGPERVIYSMSKINSKKEQNRVTFKPVGQVAIGEKDGHISERIKDIYSLFASGVPTVISENIYLDIWRKYMLNAACNTVETIFKGTHRWFQNIPEACDAMECIMQEIVALANAMDVPLSQQDIRSLDGFFKNYDPNGMCSMVQDMLYGNPTEIDMFMGEALRLGRQYHVKLPVCRFVYDIITSMEKARAFL
jgi:2-dehydropantoate 2-reductase